MTLVSASSDTQGLPPFSFDDAPTVVTNGIKVLPDNVARVLDARVAERYVDVLAQLRDL
ncbi:hypothetical protein [Rathayibacter toxicus]|uniref:hypothetical protein n=1 Tax=Rathayibacter toxicus TaxID=145458 RepID=UPI001C057D22|nr:hypothetical protein [Rathayibacter toxicus]